MGASGSEDEDGWLDGADNDNRVSSVSRCGSVSKFCGGGNAGSGGAGVTDERRGRGDAALDIALGGMMVSSRIIRMWFDSCMRLKVGRVAMKSRMLMAR